MDILTEAYLGLFPDKSPLHELRLKYSGRFSGYNANVYYTAKKMEFRLSKNWRGINKEIKIGLIQSLMQKAFRTKKSTINTEMYNIFLKKVHIAVPVKSGDPELESSFKRINDAFFGGIIEPANLCWGKESLSRFGSYSYGSDQIRINPLLKGNQRLLDYVMYHEMLHKKFKFTSSSTRCFHHTKEFRAAEERYPDKEELEKELKELPRRQTGQKKRRGFFNWF